ncbi:MAG: carbohydrate porin [Candidatus Omnitrophica bacterium]|nr:carbohydrate porin [Candidatus Omnitrophota bacterium]
MNKKLSVLLSVLLFPGIVNAASDGGLLLKNQREAWAMKGLSFDPHLIEDYVSVLKGTTHKDTWLGKFDFITEMDLEKAGILKGGLIHFDVLNTHGGLKPTADQMVGDLQTVSDIEATRSTRIYEAWYQQSILDNKLSVKFGVIDLNSEFLVSDSGGLYINSALNMIPSMWINNQGEAIYPEPVPAVRLKYSPNEKFDVLVGFFQGNPLGNDDNPHSTHFGTRHGLLSIEEGQYHYKISWMGQMEGTLKAGFWLNSTHVQDVSAIDIESNPVMYKNNYGAYAIWDQAIFRVKDDQGLNIFLLGGGSPQNRNTLEHSIGGGLNYTGLIPRREKDILGFALTSASLSNKLRASTGQDRCETIYEGMYQIHIHQSIYLQPDIQYVFHPNGDPNIANATVFMLRTDVHF